jgi:hypothetical protein
MATAKIKKKGPNGSYFLGVMTTTVVITFPFAVFGMPLNLPVFFIVAVPVRNVVISIIFRQIIILGLVITPLDPIRVDCRYLHLR